MKIESRILGWILPLLTKTSSISNGSYIENFSKSIHYEETNIQKNK